jgi:hypothetical protein
MPPRTKKSEIVWAGAGAGAGAPGIPNVLLIAKDGTLEMKPISPTGAYDFGSLYRLCGFRKMDNFERRHTWRVLGGSHQYITLFAKTEGKSDTINALPLPEHNKRRYYGTMCVIYSKSATLENGTILDLNTELWEKLYKKMMSGEMASANVGVCDTTADTAVSASISTSVPVVALTPTPTVVSSRKNTAVLSSVMPANLANNSVQHKVINDDTNENDSDEDNSDDESVVERPHGFLSDDEEDDDDDDEEDEEDDDDDINDDMMLENDEDDYIVETTTKKNVTEKSSNNHKGVNTKTVTSSVAAAAASSSTINTKKRMSTATQIKNQKNISVTAKTTGKSKNKGKGKGKTKPKSKSKKTKSSDDFDGDDGIDGGGDFDEADEFNDSEIGRAHV